MNATLVSDFAFAGMYVTRVPSFDLETTKFRVLHRRLTTKKSVLVESLLLPLESSTSFGGHDGLRPLQISKRDIPGKMSDFLLYFLSVWEICSADKRLVFHVMESGDIYIHTYRGSEPL